MLKKRKKLPEKNDCLKIGEFKRTHGLDGTLVVKNFTKEFTQKPSLVFLEFNNIMVPFFLKKESIIARNHNSFFVNVESIDSDEHAKELIGLEIYIPEEMKVKNAEKKSSFHEFTGYQLVDKERGRLGKILSVENYSGNRLFKIFFQEKEILYPFIEENIIEVDRNNMIIVSSSPEGIFEINL